MVMQNMDEHAQTNNAGWWFGCHQFYFPINIGVAIIIPIDEVIFFRGVAQPPTRMIVEQADNTCAGCWMVSICVNVQSHVYNQHTWGSDNQQHSYSAGHSGRCPGQGVCINWDMATI